MTVKTLAVLQEMWDWDAMTSRAGYEERAPYSFRINDRNHTGGRLYELLGHHDLLVTNACPELVRGPQERGTPDPEWLGDNLKFIREEDGYEYQLLLVCGRVAERTFYESPYVPDCRTIIMPHPAARGWTRDGLRRCSQFIRFGLSNLQIQLRARGLGGIEAKRI